MLYRIGDVSKHLNISDQMIRYYEKCGVIHPVRSGDGRYRYYSEMDIFLLFEVMKYKQSGMYDILLCFYCVFTICSFESGGIMMHTNTYTSV